MNPSAVSTAAFVTAGRPLYEMRPPNPADRAELAELLGERQRWLASRGLSAEGFTPDVVADGAVVNGRHMTWLLWEGRSLIGYTSLFPLTLAGGWTARDYGESALTIISTYTHPAHRQDRPSRLMAWWVLDYAARHRFRHVRRAPSHKRLALYFRDEHGWQYRRATSWPDGTRRFLMTREAELMPGLSALVATPAHPASIPTCSNGG